MPTIRQKAVLFERWLTNVLVHRKAVLLNDCVEEFGHSFGHDGDHFFIQALKSGESVERIVAFLRSYYQRFRIQSFNQIVGHPLASEKGGQYFCPWEEARSRSLDRFLPSHKAGPTPDEYLPKIASRLLRTLSVIRTQGFRQLTVKDGIFRGYRIVDGQGRWRFVIRDGQHRAAVLSYLSAVSKVWVCYESQYFSPSLYSKVKTMAGRRKTPLVSYLSVVDERHVDSWPWVASGEVDRDDAIAFFQAKFGRQFGRNEAGRPPSWVG